MSVVGPVQSHYHEGSPIGKRGLFKVRRIFWKDRFWAWSETVKKCWMMRVGIIMISWQVDEEVNQDKTGEADEMNLEVERSVIFKQEMRKRSRKRDNRWGAGTASTLKRDQIAKIAKVSACKIFVGKTEKFIFDTFVNL